MTAVWITVAGLCVTTACIKAFGPVVFGGRELPRLLVRVIRLLAPALVRRLNAELGDGSVTRVKIRGPATQRRPGQWRTRDSRGPRDTYG